MVFCSNLLNKINHCIRHSPFKVARGSYQQYLPQKPPRTLRLVLNGILYRAKPGCQWPMLPPTFGPWQTVYGYFNRWRRAGPGQRLLDALTRQQRTRQGRRHRRPECQDSHARPSYRVRRRETGPRGRKCHLFVDSQGSILQCKVPAAAGLKALLRDYFAAGVQRLRTVWVDAGYRGEALNAWGANLKQTYKIRLDVREKPRPGFTLLKRRWVVERTFAWLGNYRIHAKDYEILTDNS